MKNILFTSTFIVAILLVIIGVVNYSQQKAEASVNIGNGYSSYIATSTANLQIVRGGSGILGSIIIASSSAPYATTGSLPFRVYDAQAATSTATSTLIAAIRSGVSEQTITFDRNVLRGIVLDVPAGFTGNYVITYR